MEPESLTGRRVYFPYWSYRFESESQHGLNLKYYLEKHQSTELVEVLKPKPKLKKMPHFRN